MKTVKTFALIAAMLMLATSAFAQADRFKDIKIQTKHVAGNVYMLVGSGGNIGVTAGKDGLLMIDDQYAPLADKINNALAALGKGELQFILNTHYHGDHTGGNEIMGKTAKIVAHEKNRARLLSDENFPKGGLPVITFDDNLYIYFNGEKIEAIHMPASHTDGDMIIHFTGSNVWHLGDIFFMERFPYIDVNAGGTAEGLLATVKKALELIPADALIIPGHGEKIATKTDLAKYLYMLESSIATVKAGLAEGKSLADIQKTGLDPKYESYSWNFINSDRFIDSIYKSLVK